MTPKSGLATRTRNDEQEEQANWLAGALLLPRGALPDIRWRGMSNEEACRKYDVSSAILKFRMNVTDVDVQLLRGG